MLVSDVVDNTQKAKLLSRSNDEINATLTRMGKGKFTLKEKFELAVIGVKTSDMQDMANCAKQIVDANFKGDAKAALNFIETVNKTSIGHLDFNQMVHSGAADRLVKLSQTDPAGFQKFIAGNYPDIGSLNTALGAPAPKTAAAAPQLKQQPAMS